MEDLCEKCSGWIRNSKTADAHDPKTWCTCYSGFYKGFEKDEVDKEKE